MGILSALSGKIYHFNSINTPIDNELAHRVQELDDSLEKLVLAVSFDVSSQSVLEMFHPDNGMFKKYINDLSKDNLRNIWNILIVWVAFQISEGNQNVNRKKVLKNLALVLGLNDRKIDMLSIPFKDKKQDYQLIALWDIICNQIGIKSDNDSFNKFADLFINVFNKNFEKLNN